MFIKVESEMISESIKSKSSNKLYKLLSIEEKTFERIDVIELVIIEIMFNCEEFSINIHLLIL